MLTPKQKRFADEYLKDQNATQAAVRAGYSESTAKQQGSRLLTNVDVAVYLQEITAARSERTGIEADAVLREIYAIATADTNEVVQYRRNCCRYCWGLDFGYQRTRSEFEADQQKTADMGEEFEQRGGMGFDKRRPPNSACPECFGDGEGEVFIADTRTLSPAVRALYAGVKKTKDGIEVKLHSKDKHVELLGQHLGLFKQVHEHKGAVGLVDVAQAIDEKQREAVALEILRAAGYEIDG